MKEKEMSTEKEVVQSIFLGEEKERIRISEEIHDGIGAKLSGIKMHLEKQLENLEINHPLVEIHKQLNESINELRDISHHLQPEFIHKLGLMNALRELTFGLNSIGKTKFSFYSNINENINLDRDLSLHIYRIISELLSNIIKHAQASEAFCQLISSNGTLILSVEDNGIGFKNEEEQNNKGIGLSNIKKRVSLLAGSLSVDSGKGTSIVIEIPL